LRVAIAEKSGEGRAGAAVEDNGQGLRLPGRAGDLATMGRLAPSECLSKPHLRVSGVEVAQEVPADGEHHGLGSMVALAQQIASPSSRLA